MKIPQKVIKFLSQNKVKYETINHRTVYTAYDKAATLKVPEKIVGKTLVMRIDKKVALVLIPANKNLDKKKLKKTAKALPAGRQAKKIDFLKEAWMKKNLKGIKIGATPPFGNLWKFSTFADRALFQNPKIIVNSGDYNWSIKINPNLLKKIIPNLIIGSFSKSRG